MLAGQGSSGRLTTAGERPRRPPVPPCLLRMILASSDAPQDGQTDFLKLLALRPGSSDVASMSFADGCGRWRGAAEEVYGACGA